MESRTDMIARHTRELAELKLLETWWVDSYTEDPFKLFEKCCIKSIVSHRDWFVRVLPTIIRKRENEGIIISMYSAATDKDLCSVEYEDGVCGIPWKLACKLAGRTLAPGEKVDL